MVVWQFMKWGVSLFPKHTTCTWELFSHAMQAKFINLGGWPSRILKPCMTYSSIITVLLWPDLLHVSLGYHCRSDPVQVQSWNWNGRWQQIKNAVQQCVALILHPTWIKSHNGCSNAIQVMWSCELCTCYSLPWCKFHTARGILHDSPQHCNSQHTHIPSDTSAFCAEQAASLQLQ